MALDVNQLDAYVKLLLVERRDDDNAAFPRGIRVRALQEAVLSIGRVRPDLFAVEALLDPASDGFTLPVEFDRLLEVRGLVDGDGSTTALRYMTADQMAKLAVDWRSATGPARHFHWSATNPRRVYVNGSITGCQLAVVASRIDQLVDGSEDPLPLPQSFFPAVADAALERLYEREDTSSGTSAYYAERFRRFMADSAGSDGAQSPATLAAPAPP